MIGLTCYSGTVIVGYFKWYSVTEKRKAVLLAFVLSVDSCIALGEAIEY